MATFALLSSRDDDDVTARERASFLRHTGLRESDLEQVRLEDPTSDADGFDASAYRGVFLGGSPFNWTAPAKSQQQRLVEHRVRRIIAQAIENDLPFFGACYGIGSLGSVLGGTLDATHAELASAARLELTAAGQRDPLTASLPQTFEGFVGHTEALATLPAGADLLVTSPTCPVQMMRVGANVYATQFHPELDFQDFAERLARYEGHGYYPTGGIAAVLDATRETDTSAAHHTLAAFADRYGDAHAVAA